MITVLLIVHLFVTLALIGVVLIQRSEGGGLGVGTSQGMGGFMSGRGTANLLTRTTAILATAFFVLSMALALLNRGTTVGRGTDILDRPPTRGTPALPSLPTSGLPASPSPAMTPNPDRTPSAPPDSATVPPVTPPGAAIPALPQAPPPPASAGSPNNGPPPAQH